MPHEPPNDRHHIELICRGVSTKFEVTAEQLEWILTSLTVNRERQRMMLERLRREQPTLVVGKFAQERVGVKG
jgi:hypothetical protein